MLVSTTLTSRVRLATLLACWSRSVAYPTVSSRPRAEKYMLMQEEWKYDPIPEIMDGKNVADFVDPEIEARLDSLEREEERMEAEGAYLSESEMVRTTCLLLVRICLADERLTRRLRLLGGL